MPGVNADVANGQWPRLACTCPLARGKNKQAAAAAAAIAIFPSFRNTARRPALGDGK